MAKGKQSLRSYLYGTKTELQAALIEAMENLEREPNLEDETEILKLKAKLGIINEIIKLCEERKHY